MAQRSLTDSFLGHFVRQQSVKETALWNVFISLANMAIFTVGIREFLEKSHQEADDFYNIKASIRPVLWLFYFCYWGLEIDMSMNLTKGAKKRELMTCKHCLHVEIGFFCIWLICFALHSFWLTGFNPVLQTCCAVLSLQKGYLFWVVLDFIKELKRLGGLNQLLEPLSDEEVAKFFLGNPEVAYADFSWIPYDQDWEISSERTKLQEEIGEGISSRVYKAIILVPGSGDTPITVTVALKRKTGEGHSLQSQWEELKIMIHLGSHPNVAQLLGAHTSKIRERVLDIIIEYCPFGDLAAYLQGATCRDQLDNHGELCCCSTPSGYVPMTSRRSVNNVTIRELIKWSLDIARGMEYIHSKLVIHTDLAARNVLLSYDKFAKVADFGFACTLSSDKNYFRSLQCHLPILWMAPESTMDPLKFTRESDIWSYGVTLWEIFSLGVPPYTEAPLLPRPRYAPRAVYHKIMRRCWESNPSARITWPEIIQQLEDFLRLIDMKPGCDRLSCETWQQPPISPHHL